MSTKHSRSRSYRPCEFCTASQSIQNLDLTNVRYSRSRSYKPCEFYTVLWGTQDLDLIDLTSIIQPRKVFKIQILQTSWTLHNLTRYSRSRSYRPCEVCTTLWSNQDLDLIDFTSFVQLCNTTHHTILHLHTTLTHHTHTLHTTLHITHYIPHITSYYTHISHIIHTTPHISQ